MTFSASSEPEFIAWLLSFGREAKLIKPDWLVEEVKEIVKRLQKDYSERRGSSVAFSHWPLYPVCLCSL